VRVHPDHDPLDLLTHTRASVASNQSVVGRGGHRYFEQSNPFLSLSCPAAPGPRSPCESHTTQRGQPRMRATNPGTWTEPAQAPVLASMKQVAAVRSCRHSVCAVAGVSLLGWPTLKP
jgi:hypothetical protein